MKRIFLTFLCVLFLFCGAAMANDPVTFEWDPVTASDLAGYRLYKSDVSGSYTFGPDNALKQISAGGEIVSILLVPGTWYFVVTAFDVDGDESGPSNEVSLTVEDPNAGAPAGPQNLTVTVTVSLPVKE